jgi:hypothetical protein
VQRLFLQLLLQGVSLRGVPRVLTVVAEALPCPLPIPHWTTGRLWLLRLGHAMLTMALEQAQDWAWLIDHSVQIGQEKCLVILGIRLRDLPEPGVPLAHSDLRLVALVPRVSWTRQEVDEQLEVASQRTGVPRAIVDDHGVDIAGGVRFFQERHPQTVEIYDAKHKAACLLKHRLERDPRWADFNRQLAFTRCALHQTELAALVPPAAKPKARFMNLEPTLRWAENVLGVLRQPPAVVRERVSTKRLQEKLGWLQTFAAALAEWSEWQALVNVVVQFVNAQGLFRGAARQVKAALRPYRLHDSSQALAQELVAFVAEQTRRLRAEERVPGSTEVLESCFGRLKQLEKQQARGGFTSLILGFGAFLADTSKQVIQEALQHSRTKDIVAWCREHLGMTLFSQRKLAFAPAQQNADENGH